MPAISCQFKLLLNREGRRYESIMSYWNYASRTEIGLKSNISESIVSSSQHRVSELWDSFPVLVKLGSSWFDFLGWEASKLFPTFGTFWVNVPTVLEHRARPFSHNNKTLHKFISGGIRRLI